MYSDRRVAATPVSPLFRRYWVYEYLARISDFVVRVLSTLSGVPPFVLDFDLPLPFPVRDPPALPRLKYPAAT